MRTPLNLSRSLPPSPCQLGPPNDDFLRERFPNRASLPSRRLHVFRSLRAPADLEAIGTEGRRTTPRSRRVPAYFHVRADLRDDFFRL